MVKSNCKANILSRCEERTLALSLCSWKFDDESSLDDYVKQLESAQQYTRAAAVCVFNRNIHRAIKVLETASFKDSSLNTTAMALAGRYEHLFTSYLCEIY